MLAPFPLDVDELLMYMAIPKNKIIVRKTTVPYMVVLGILASVTHLLHCGCALVHSVSVNGQYKVGIPNAQSAGPWLAVGWSTCSTWGGVGTFTGVNGEC